MPAPKVWVTALTVGATAVVVALAVQADQGVKPTAASSARPGATASASPAPSASATPGQPSVSAVPDDSGTGRRIVYSLSAHRVWLVDASDAVRRTFTVWPGTVSPDPGTYKVDTRRDAITGSDGVQIEHVVYFATKDGLSVAFSNALDGSSPPPVADGGRTSGIRMKKDDGTALWRFGTTGTTVVVVD